MARKYNFLLDTIIGRQPEDYMKPDGGAAAQYRKTVGPTPTERKTTAEDILGGIMFMPGIGGPGTAAKNVSNAGKIINGLVRGGKGAETVAKVAEATPGIAQKWNQATKTWEKVAPAGKNILQKGLARAKKHYIMTGLGALAVAGKGVNSINNIMDKGDANKPEIGGMTPLNEIPGYAERAKKNGKGGGVSTPKVDPYANWKASDIEYGKPSTEQKARPIYTNKADVMGTKERDMRRNMMDTYATMKGTTIPEGVPMRKDIESFKTNVKTLPKEDVAALIAKYKAGNFKS